VCVCVCVYVLIAVYLQCVGILNYFRSVERTLTISDAGLTCQDASQHYQQTRFTAVLYQHHHYLLHSFKTRWSCFCVCNNNSNSHDSVYGAVIVRARVRPVHLTNVARSARWQPTFGPSRSAWANRSAYRQL